MAAVCKYIMQDLGEWIKDIRMATVKFKSDDVAVQSKYGTKVVQEGSATRRLEMRPFLVASH